MSEFENKGARETPVAAKGLTSRVGGWRLHRVCLFLVVTIGAATTRAQSWPSIATELPPGGGGDKDAAVVVGITNYAFLPKVPGAAENAGDWARYFSRVRQVPATKVTLLRDNEATKERIEAALTNAAKQTQAGGRTWFIFIGHGAPSSSGDDGLILGVDTQPDADSLTNRGLAQALVLSRLDGVSSSVAVFDACFSGRSSDGTVDLVRGLQATLPVRKVKSERATTLASSETFAGSLPGTDRPAFSYVLLGAMRGWADSNGDGSVSVDEAIGYARDALQVTLKGSNRLPSARGKTANVTLATNAREGPPELDAIVTGSCPSAKRWTGRVCERIPCPTGTAWNGALCVALAESVQCPQGTRWSGSACVTESVSCPAGAAWNGSSCVSEGKVLAPATEPGATVSPKAPTPKTAIDEPLASPVAVKAADETPATHGADTRQDDDEQAQAESPPSAADVSEGEWVWPAAAVGAGVLTLAVGGVVAYAIVASLPPPTATVVFTPRVAP